MFLHSHAHKYRTLPPKVWLNSEQLALKKSQLESLVQLYKDYINELNQGSKAIFGEVWFVTQMCIVVLPSYKDLQGAQSMSAG